MTLSRRWRRGLAIYAALLVASHVVQAWRHGDRPLPRHRHTALVTVEGEHIRLAYADSGDAVTEAREGGGHPLPNPLPKGEGVGSCPLPKGEGAGPGPHAEGGSALPLVLLHGSPGSADDFGHLMPHLVAGRRVIAVDLPGFGASDLWVRDYGLEAHAQAVRGLLDALAVERAHVLGFSMGSGVALQLTRHDPQRVASLTLYGGIGVQEHEGSGDYAFEHLKYRIGYVALVALPEVLPHFGLLGPRDRRHAFIRNFMDSDQRPLRAILAGLDTPTLILHGRHDPLVPARAAYEHHRLVRHSELVMYDDSHFMLFDADKAAVLAAEIGPFLRRAEAGQLQRRTDDRTAGHAEADPVLPTGWDLRAMSPWMQMAAIIVSSWVLEDPTTVLAGLLVKQGQLDWLVAVLGVFVGIFSGDLLLYGVGRVGGRRVLQWPWVARRLPVHRTDALGAWFDRHGWTAVLACRFVPGTRLPLYVAAGALGRRPLRFAWWCGLSVAIWAPIMLVLVIVLGAAAASPVKAVVGDSWLAWVVLAVLLLAVLRVVTLAVTPLGRARLRATWGRWTRMEFWPGWLFYVPLVPWYAWLSLRYRSFTVWTLANPAIPHGGVVGESKHAILARIDPRRIVPSAWLGAGEKDGGWRDDASVERTGQLQQLVAARGWVLPLVLKPDSGQRGVSVKLIRTWEDASRYLDATPGPVLVQTYDPGPHEAGVFWYRFPGDACGRILSITDKVFPVLEGDGQHTLEQLIWRHPRYRMQAGVFLRRHELQRDRVLAAGERLPLAMAGNHCQGTLFRDGSHLATEALREALDDALHGFDGFHIGRFDLRYSCPDALGRGEGFAIVELNGVTSEATALYDPAWWPWHRYGLLFRQWSLLFDIGAAVRARTPGLRPIAWPALLRMVRRYYRTRVIDSVSD